MVAFWELRVVRVVKSLARKRFISPIRHPVLNIVLANEAPTGLKSTGLFHWRKLPLATIELGLTPIG